MEKLPFTIVSGTEVAANLAEKLGIAPEGLEKVFFCVGIRG